MNTILSDSVKQLIKKISDVEDQNESLFIENSEALEKALIDYDIFWKCVIVSTIGLRSIKKNSFNPKIFDKQFVNRYLKNHSHLCEEIIANASVSDGEITEEVKLFNKRLKEEYDKLVEELG